MAKGLVPLSKSEELDSVIITLENSLMTLKMNKNIVDKKFGPCKHSGVFYGLYIFCVYVNPMRAEKFTVLIFLNPFDDEVNIYNSIQLIF